MEDIKNLWQEILACIILLIIIFVCQSSSQSNEISLQKENKKLQIQINEVKKTNEN